MVSLERPRTSLAGASPDRAAGPRLAAAIVSAAVSVVVSCGTPGPLMTTDGGTSSGCMVGELDCTCHDDNTCNDGLVCASKLCVDPGGTTEVGTSEGTTGSSGEGSETSASTSTTSTTSECAPADGSENADCAALDPSSPYCAPSGQCVDCSALACEGVDPSTPVCGPLGLCQECSAEHLDACGPGSPVCDIETGLCEGCEEHADCPTTACDFDTGACFPEDSVVWVDQSDPSCNPMLGTLEAPYCSLAEAIDALSGDTAIMVHGGEYTGELSIPGPNSVAIRAVDGADEVVVTTDMGTVLSVEPGAAVSLEGLTVKQGTDGISCNLGQLVLDRVVVREHTTAGVVLTSCTTTVRASIVFFNGSRGVTMAGGTLRMENAFVSDNSIADIAGGAGMVVTAGADISILYSTLVGNDGTVGGPGSIVCEGPLTPTINLRNSVIYGASFDSMDLQNCAVTTANCAYDYEIEAPEVEDGDLLQLGEGNIDLVLVRDGPDASAGVYRAQPGDSNLLRTLAQWKAGDPKVDFEGHARPAEEDAEDYAGADRIP